MSSRHRNPGHDRWRSSRSIRRYREARDEFNSRQEAVFKKAGKLAAEYLISIGMLPVSSLHPKLRGNDKFNSSCRSGDNVHDDDMRRRRRSGERRWRGRDCDDDDFRDGDGRRRSRDGRRSRDCLSRDRRRSRDCLSRDRRRSPDCLSRDRRRSRDCLSRDRRRSPDCLSRDRRRFHDGKRPRSDDDVGRLDLENSAAGVECGVAKAVGRDDETMNYESGEVRDDFGVVTMKIEDDGGATENGVDLSLDCRFMRVPTKPRTKRRRVDCSSSDHRKSLSKHSIDLNKAPSDDDLVSDGEAKMDTSADLKGKSLCEEFDITKNDLLKLCRFKNVPTKARTSFRRRSSKTTMVSKIVEIVSEVSKAMEGEDLVVGVASDSQLNEPNISNCKELSNSSIIPSEHVTDSVDQGDILTQSPIIFESSSQKFNVQEEVQLSGHSMNPGLSKVLPVDVEMMKEHVLDQVKIVNGDFSQKIETELNIENNMEVEEQLQPTLFKVCDLNLMAPPEISSEIVEAHDDPISDHLHSKEIPMGFDHTMEKISIITNGYFRLSGDKMIPVIDLEDDSSIESNDCDSPKTKIENMHSRLSNHRDNRDPHGSYGGSSLLTTKLHQTDTFGGSLAPQTLIAHIHE